MLKSDSIMNKIKDAARFEGRAEGLAEGRAEGLAEGRTQGLAEGEKKACLKMTRELLRLKRITSDEAENLFGLSQAEVKQLSRELEEESGSLLPV